MEKKFIQAARTMASAAFMVAVVTLGSVPVHAQVTARDVLIKGPGDGAAVYYLANNGKRYVFPNQKTYATWFMDFGSVMTVSLADLQSFPLGGNVTYRPGIKLVKITTDPKVYAVGPNGQLRWVASEAVAASLYGANWNQKVDDVPDAFFVNYSVGSPINSVTDFSPASAASGTTTINDDLNISKGSYPEMSNTVPETEDVSHQDVTSCEWNCTDWSDCNYSLNQTRTCTLSSSCTGTATAQPAVTRSCGEQQPTTTPPSSINTDAGNVIAGTTAVLAKFKLTALYEPLRLTKASFHVATPNAVVRLSLYDGDTLVGGPADVNGAGDAFLTGVNFVVPANASNDLYVRGQLNTVGPSGVPSGSNAKVTLKDTAGAYVFEMRGANLGSNTIITALSGGDVSGNDKILRQTVPTVSLAQLSNQTLTSGSAVLLRFTVTANPSGDVAIKALTASVNKPNAASLVSAGDAGHATVRVMGDSQNLQGHSTFDAGCAAAGGTACTIRTEFASEEVVPAGTSKTYDVRATVGDTLAVGDSTSSSLLGDAAVVTGSITDGPAADQVSVAGTGVFFAWSDGSGLPHSPTSGMSSNDWISGQYVKMLPTDTQSLVK